MQTYPTAENRLAEALSTSFGQLINPNKITLSDLKIRTKDRQLVTLEPNVPQQMYLDILCPNWRLGDFSIRGKRELLLKARQEGFSTLIAALYFLDTLNTPRTYSVIIANDQETTNKIFDIVKRFYNNLPSHKKPDYKYASRTEYYWPDVDSTFYVGTAGSRQFGRGTTVNNVHGSEVAFWEDADSIVSGLMEAVPEEDGNLILETTANGMGNYYHKTWQNPGNLSKRFFPWFILPSYSKPAPEDFVPTAVELERKEAYGLTIDQLYWYRDKGTTPGLKIKQEYPFNDKEAFLATGNSYFDLETLDAYLTSSANATFDVPLFKGDWLSDGNPAYVEFKPPTKGRRYVIGADSAEGLTDDGDHDYCTAQVLDIETWEQVARYKTRKEPIDFADDLAALGRRYNTALLVVERNNHGHAVLLQLIHHTDYPRMKRDEWGGIYYHLDYDASRKQRTRKPGYPTTAKTKVIALDALAESILERDIGINDQETIGELMTYQKLPGAKYGAMTGCHDDLVIALALASLFVRDAPKPKVKGKPKIKRGELL